MTQLKTSIGVWILWVQLAPSLDSNKGVWLNWPTTISLRKLCNYEILIEYSKYALMDTFLKVLGWATFSHISQKGHLKENKGKDLRDEIFGWTIKTPSKLSSYPYLDWKQNSMTLR